MLHAFSLEFEPIHGGEAGEMASFGRFSIYLPERQYVDSHSLEAQARRFLSGVCVLGNADTGFGEVSDCSGSSLFW